MNAITIILILVVGIILGGIFHFQKKESGLFLGKWKISKQTKEKEENKRKILEFLNTNLRIVNDDVEKLVRVSDATAERYLDELEKEGKINQIGKTGHYTYYQLK